MADNFDPSVLGSEGLSTGSGPVDTGILQSPGLQVQQAGSNAGVSGFDNPNVAVAGTPQAPAKTPSAPAPTGTVKIAVTKTPSNVTPTANPASGKSYINEAGQTVKPANATEEANMVKLGFKQAGAVPPSFGTNQATGTTYTEGTQPVTTEQNAYASGKINPDVAIGNLVTQKPDTTKPTDTTDTGAASGNSYIDPNTGKTVTPATKQAEQFMIDQGYQSGKTYATDNDRMNAIATAIKDGGFSTYADIAGSVGMSASEVQRIVDGNSGLTKAMQYAQDNNITQTAIDAANKKIMSLLDGTYQLTADEQAQVDSMQKQYDQIKADQLEANKNYQGAIMTAEIRSGRQEFMTQISSGIYAKAVNDGIRKITDIETQATAAIASFKQALKDNDYKMAAELQDNLSKQMTAKTEEINKLATLTSTLYKTSIQQLADSQAAQKAQLEIDKTKADLTKAQAPETVTSNGISYAYDAKTDTWNPIGDPNAATTTTQKDYEYYVNQEKAAGRTPQTFEDYISNQKAPAAVKEYNAAVKAGFTGSLADYAVAKKGAGASLDADTIQFLAEQYMVDGKQPSFGYGVAAMPMKAQFYKAVASIAHDRGLTGQEAAANRVAISASKAALTNQMKLNAATKQAEEAAIANMEVALKQAEKIPKYQMPDANKFSNWVQGKIGNKDLTSFEVALFTATREYAKVASGSAGSVAGLTESAIEDAKQIINSSMNMEQLRAAVDMMKVDMKNVEESQTGTVQQLNDDILDYSSGGVNSPGDLKVNDDGTYTYKNNDGTIYNGTTGDNHQDYSTMSDEDRVFKYSDAGNVKEINDIISKTGYKDAKSIWGYLEKAHPNLYSGGFNNDLSMSGNGSRTDRHNNPTAFTTDIAKNAGLIEGVDYVKGDPFSNGQYHTAKILGDPIATTIKVIDNIGFQTSSGKPRWTYINMSKSKWDGLSYDQKKDVIGTMYKNEGGSQLKNYFV